jgi:hypothetical protein
LLKGPEKEKEVPGLHSTLAQTPAIGAMTANWETVEGRGEQPQQQPQGQQQQDKSAEEEWVATSEWVESWKSKLPLQTIMRVLQILVPQVEKICIDKLDALIILLLFFSNNPLPGV